MMNSRFSGSSGFGSWSGNSPFGVQYAVSSSQAETLEQRPDHRPCHPVAAVDDDPQRLDRVRVDESERRLVELVEQLDLLDSPAAGRLARDRASIIRCTSPIPASPDSAIAPRLTSFAPV